MDIRIITIFGREVIISALSALWTKTVSPFLHSVKFAVMKSKHQEMQGGNGLSSQWPSISTPSSFSDLLPQGPCRHPASFAQKLLIPQQFILASSTAVPSHSQGQAGSGLRPQWAASVKVCVTGTQILSWFDSRALSSLLAFKGRRVGKRVKTRSLYLLASFSLSLVLFFLNRMCDLGLWKASSGFSI